MKKVLPAVLFLSSQLFSADIGCGTTASCIRGAYVWASPSFQATGIALPGGGSVGISSITAGNTAMSGAGGALGGSQALSSLRSAAKNTEALKSGGSESSGFVSALSSSTQKELLALSKTTHSILKCKNVESLHSDLLSLEIRKTLVFSEAKILSLSEKLNETTEHALKEIPKDAYR